MYVCTYVCTYVCVYVCHATHSTRFVTRASHFHVQLIFLEIHLTIIFLPFSQVTLYKVKASLDVTTIESITSQLSKKPSRYWLAAPRTKA